MSAKTSEPLHRSRIHAVLRNPIYMGEFDWKGVRYRGAHEPLVSREVWERAQEVLSGRAPRRRITRQRHQFTFSGLVYCGVCADEGKRFLLVAEIKKGRYIYYRCEECKRRGRASYTREEKIAEAYAIALTELNPNDKLLDMARAALSEDTEKSDDHRRLTDLKAEFSTLEHLLDMAYEDRLAGRIDPSHFDQRALGWRGQMDALRQEVDELEATSPRTDRPPALELQQLVELFRKSEKGSQKRHLVEILHSNSAWRDGKLDVTWKRL